MGANVSFSYETCATDKQHSHCDAVHAHGCEDEEENDRRVEVAKMITTSVVRKLTQRDLDVKDSANTDRTKPSSKRRFSEIAKRRNTLCR